MHRSLLIRLGLCVLILLLTACAGKKAQESLDPTVLWERFCAHTNKDVPYRVALSLRLGQKGDTRRVTALLWGNTYSPIRLDVMAGVGSIVAKIRRTERQFLVLSPMESKAYTHEGTNQPRLKLGIPLPFTIQNLAQLVNGAYSEVFGTMAGANEQLSNTTVRYNLVEPMQGSLVVNNKGLPLHWQDPKGWVMRFYYAPDNSLLRLHLENSRGEQFIVFVKERATPEPFDDEAMTLAIPRSYKVLPLARYAAQTKSLQ